MPESFSFLGRGIDLALDDYSFKSRISWRNKLEIENKLKERNGTLRCTHSTDDWQLLSFSDSLCEQPMIETRLHRVKLSIQHGASDFREIDPDFALRIELMKCHSTRRSLDPNRELTVIDSLTKKPVATTQNAHHRSIAQGPCIQILCWRIIKKSTKVSFELELTRAFSFSIRFDYVGIFDKETEMHEAPIYRRSIRNAVAVNQIHASKRRQETCGTIISMRFCECQKQWMNSKTDENLTWRDWCDADNAPNNFAIIQSSVYPSVVLKSKNSKAMKKWKEKKIWKILNSKSATTLTRRTGEVWTWRIRSCSLAHCTIPTVRSVQFAFCYSCVWANVIRQTARNDEIKLFNKFSFEWNFCRCCNAFEGMPNAIRWATKPNIAEIHSRFGILIWKLAYLKLLQPEIALNWSREALHSTICKRMLSPCNGDCRQKRKRHFLFQGNSSMTCNQISMFRLRIFECFFWHKVLSLCQVTFNQMRTQNHPPYQNHSQIISIRKWTTA